MAGTRSSSRIKCQHTIKGKRLLRNLSKIPPHSPHFSTTFTFCKIRYGKCSSYYDKSVMKKRQKYISPLKRNPIAEILREIFQSAQVFQGVRSSKKNAMNKDEVNVGDGKGMEEDLKKEMDMKKKVEKSEVGSLNMKRTPP